MAAQDRALRALLTGTTHFVALVEADGTIAYVAPSTRALLGWEPAELIGRSVADYIHPEDLTMALSMLASEVDKPQTGDGFVIDADISGDYRILHRDGRWVPFEILRNNFLANPDIAGLLVLGRPVVSRYALDSALGTLAYDTDGIEALQRLIAYLDARMPDTASAVVTAGSPPEWIQSPAADGLTGGRGPWDRAVGSDVPVYASADIEGDMDPALASVALDRGWLSCWCMPVPIRNPQVYAAPLPSDINTDDLPTSGCLVVWSRHDREPPLGWVGVIERASGLANIALQRRSERQSLRRMVDYDRVTGALTRAGLESTLRRSEPRPMTHILLDLDDFKLVNDRYGHQTGDEVLRLAVKRIMALLREHDMIVRMGGDEFLILLTETEPAVGVSVAERILAAFRGPFRARAVTVPVTASLGVAPWDGTATFEQLTERADRAMYRAKGAGKSTWAR